MRRFLEPQASIPFGGIIWGWSSWWNWNSPRQELILLWCTEATTDAQTRSALFGSAWSDPSTTQGWWSQPTKAPTHMWVPRQAHHQERQIQSNFLPSQITSTIRRITDRRTTPPIYPSNQRHRTRRFLGATATISQNRSEQARRSNSTWATRACCCERGFCGANKCWAPISRRGLRAAAQAMIRCCGSCKIPCFGDPRHRISTCLEEDYQEL